MVVIVDAKRTPMGSFLGQFSKVSATGLGAAAVEGVYNSVDEVFMGCVVQAGLGQSPARQVALKAGLPISTPCTTINKVCGSAMQAIILAHDRIKAGEANAIIAGGMESMSNAPYLLDKARSGYKAGHGSIIDSLYNDGLQDAYGSKELMGVFAEETALRYGFSRQMQEDYALQTYENYQNALSYLANEITAVDVGGGIKIDKDEPPTKVKPEKFELLKPAFKKDGTVTAATSSSLADGAAALTLMSAEHAASLGLTPLARIVSTAQYAHEPQWFTTAPVGAIKKVLQKANWTDADLYEVNEAFAVVPMAVMHDLNISRDKMNVFGGACTLGHPIGCSGARIVVTLLNALRQRGLKRGVASTCIGSGEATALAVEIL